MSKLACTMWDIGIRMCEHRALATPQDILWSSSACHQNRPIIGASLYKRLHHADFRWGGSALEADSDGDKLNCSFPAWDATRLEVRHPWPFANSSASAIHLHCAKTNILVGRHGPGLPKASRRAVLRVGRRGNFQLACDGRHSYGQRFWTRW